MAARAKSAVKEDIRQLSGAERSAITGILELLRAPDYPWDPHQPLKLGISGFVFSSREIASWTKL